RGIQILQLRRKVQTPCTVGRDAAAAGIIAEVQLVQEFRVNGVPFAVYGLQFKQKKQKTENRKECTYWKKIITYGCCSSFPWCGFSFGFWCSGKKEHRGSLLIRSY